MCVLHTFYLVHQFWLLFLLFIPEKKKKRNSRMSLHFSSTSHLRAYNFHFRLLDMFYLAKNLRTHILLICFNVIVNHFAKEQKILHKTICLFASLIRHVFCFYFVFVGYYYFFASSLLCLSFFVSFFSCLFFSSLVHIAVCSEHSSKQIGQHTIRM